MSLGLLLLLSLRKEENRFFSTGKQQKSIDCLIGDALIINTCKGQHLVVSAVWQQHKQYHLQLHCVKCWQLLQNLLLGKWGNSEITGECLCCCFFFLSAQIHPSHLCSLLNISHPVWLRSRIVLVFQVACCGSVVVLIILNFKGINKAWSLLLLCFTGGWSPYAVSAWKTQSRRHSYSLFGCGYKYGLWVVSVLRYLMPNEGADFPSTEGGIKMGTDADDTSAVVMYLARAVSCRFRSCLLALVF